VAGARVSKFCFQRATPGIKLSHFVFDAPYLNILMVFYYFEMAAVVLNIYIMYFYDIPHSAVILN
jgi:hypothetical protein